MTAVTAYLFPGQGSQQRGMGGALFDEFPLFTAKADAVLGYSIRTLCLDDPQSQLAKTEFTQPALYVVSVLTYLKTLVDQPPPTFVAGHSLGEYAALFAAGAFDFETGLRLVQRRGALMQRAPAGSMMAVLGIGAAEVEGAIRGTSIDIANDNAPDQVVLAGPAGELPKIVPLLERAGAKRCVPLNVSGAFHSRLMSGPCEEFVATLQDVTFATPRIPVIANATGKPYDDVRALLAMQMKSRVQWRTSMQYLQAQGVTEVVEIGPGRVLTGLWRSNKTTTPIAIDTPKPSSPTWSASTLGSDSFRRDYGVRMSYVSGAMYKGIASKEMVVRMGKAGLLGFLGSGGLRLSELQDAIAYIRRELPNGQAFGLNLLHQPDDPRLEEETVQLYLRHDIRNVEAAAYLQITEPLVHFRFAGAHANGKGPEAARRVIAKVSRPEVARAFMSPPDESMLANLVAAGKLTADEASVARRLPIADDICVEADSGGHTDGGASFALIPAMKRLRDELVREHGYRNGLRLGAAGGIGSPEAAAAAFVLGADFILTGSINQCTPEAGTSEAVKEMLQRLDIQDTAYAPAGDMFELGARVQVMKRGVLFAARANKLYEIYRQYDSLDAIDDALRDTLEKTFFRRSIAEVWEDVRAYYAQRHPEQLAMAERNPKQRMAMVFRWYFAQTTRLAMSGDTTRAADFQVHCGPAMGAFNRFVRGTELEDWRKRHIDVIADKLMASAADLLNAALAPPRPLVHTVASSTK
ncbi:MAG TPA: ACP S-malonyltransferase [Thermoanaerobaculia bacterium]|nr:ACP S-malonyltransferase [Thermoanaerobaculia bacterium]